MNTIFIATPKRPGVFEAEGFWLVAGIGLWISTNLIVRYFCLDSGDSGLRWDATWYAEVVRNGYAFNGNLNYSQDVGFMPLFPFIITQFSRTGLSINLLMTVVPMAFSVIAIFLLYRTIEALTTREEALATVLLFMASPFSLFFINGYAESLYLLLMSLFFFSLVLLRSHALAAIAAGLASAVRPYSLVLFGVFVLWILLKETPGDRNLRRTLRSALAYGPLFVAGFFATGLYFYYSFDDLFLYRNVMVAWGYDLTSDGIGSLVDHFRTQFMAASLDFSVLRSGSPPEFAKLQFFAFALLCLAFLRKIPFLIAVYSVFLVVFVLTVSEGTATLGRHMITNIALPAMVAIAVRKWSTSRAHCATSDSSSTLGVSGWAVLVVLCLIGLALQLYFDTQFFAARWVG